jgi:predicted RNA polymerase sigma factor
MQIQRGLDALQRAEGLAQPGGPYQLQAAIAACHAHAARAEDTDWACISALYATLMQVAPSSVVELNRAVAVAMHQGPAAGLAIVDALRGDKSLSQYQWLPSVRGDLLERLGRHGEARAEFEQAAALAGNQRDKALLLERVARLN